MVPVPLTEAHKVMGWLEGLPQVDKQLDGGVIRVNVPVVGESSNWVSFCFFNPTIRVRVPFFAPNCVFDGENVTSAVARVRRILKEAALGPGRLVHFEKCLEDGILTGSLALVIEMFVNGLATIKGSTRAQSVDRILGYTQDGGRILVTEPSACATCERWSDEEHSKYNECPVKCWVIGEDVSRIPAQGNTAATAKSATVATGANKVTPAGNGGNVNKAAGNKASAPSKKGAKANKQGNAQGKDNA